MGHGGVVRRCGLAKVLGIDIRLSPTRGYALASKFLTTQPPTTAIHDASRDFWNPTDNVSDGTPLTPTSMSPSLARTLRDCSSPSIPGVLAENTAREEIGSIAFTMLGIALYCLRKRLGLENAE